MEQPRSKGSVSHHHAELAKLGTLSVGKLRVVNILGVSIYARDEMSVPKEMSSLEEREPTGSRNDVRRLYRPTVDGRAVQGRVAVAGVQGIEEVVIFFWSSGQNYTPRLSQTSRTVLHEDSATRGLVKCGGDARGESASIWTNKSQSLPLEDPDMYAKGITNRIDSHCTSKLLSPEVLFAASSRLPPSMLARKGF